MNVHQILFLFATLSSTSRAQDFVELTCPTGLVVNGQSYNDLDVLFVTNQKWINHVSSFEICIACEEKDHVIGNEITYRDVCWERAAQNQDQSLVFVGANFKHCTDNLTDVDTEIFKAAGFCDSSKSICGLRFPDDNKLHLNETLKASQPIPCNSNQKPPKPINTNTVMCPENFHLIGTFFSIRRIIVCKKDGDESVELKIQLPGVFREQRTYICPPGSYDDSSFSVAIDLFKHNDAPFCSVKASNKGKFHGVQIVPFQFLARTTDGTVMTVDITEGIHEEPFSLDDSLNSNKEPETQNNHSLAFTLLGLMVLALSLVVVGSVYKISQMKKSLNQNNLQLAEAGNSDNANYQYEQIARDI